MDARARIRGRCCRLQATSTRVAELKCYDARGERGDREGRRQRKPPAARSRRRQSIAGDAAAARASVRGSGAGAIAEGTEQQTKLERAIRVAASVGVLIGLPGLGALAAAFQEAAEVGPGGRVAPLVRAPEGRLSTLGGARSLQQEAELERAPSVPELIRTRVRSFGLRKLGAPFEEHGEVASGTGVARVGGALIDGLRAGEIAFALQKRAEVKQRLGVTRFLHGLMRIPADRRARRQASAVRSQPPYGSDHTRVSIPPERRVANDEMISYPRSGGRGI